MESSILTELFLPLVLAVIMFGMGLSLTLSDFKRILIYPKAVLLGLLNQIVLLPVVAFFIAKGLGLSPELAVGLMILAACPGGATSNLITHLAKGDTALSITLTAFSSMITVLTIPFVVNFSIGYFIPGGEEQQLEILGTVISVLVITIIPVAIGMLVLKKVPALAKKLEIPFRQFSTVFFILIVVSAFVKERDNLVQFFIDAGPASLALNLATLGLGYGVAKVAGLNFRQSLTIAVESGIQNGTLGITIAATLIVNSVMTIPSAIYSLIMFGTAALVIFWGNKVENN
ncbi:bile acid:sodium symporter family protein [Algoriphagus aquatilis]|uniref:Bile acid:sodium symporter family protein n=1 Tax=Algoriphagus aquatilis TaxID=490186 RepID=A0ABW0BX94_9BACT